MIYPQNPFCPMTDDCHCHQNGSNNGNNNENSGNNMFPDNMYCPGNNGNSNNNDNNCDCNNNNGNNSTTREEMLKRISELDFAITDLNLYLDTHPESAEALEMLTKLAATCKSLKADYVRKYGPLMVTDVENETPFSWVSPKHKWPWQM